MGANDTQIGGGHYKSDSLQHWDLVVLFNIDYLTANATKYLTRHRKKNGRQDLEKAIHYMTKLAESLDQEQGIWVKFKQLLQPIPFPLSPPMVTRDGIDVFISTLDFNDFENEIMRACLSWRDVDDVLQVIGLLNELMLEEYDTVRT